MIMLSLLLLLLLLLLLCYHHYYYYYYASKKLLFSAITMEPFKLFLVPPRWTPFQLFGVNIIKFFLLYIIFRMFCCINLVCSDNNTYLVNFS